ncbi:MAG: rhodanese-like domain-containing protein [Planctomycetaceae bacterium]
MATDTLSTITPLELEKRRQAGQSTNLVDVRTPVEYQEVHVEFARNIPLDRLNPTDVLAGHPASEPLFVICRSGNRAAKACDAIRAAGFDRVVNVEGGTTAWDEAGLPVIRGKNAVSLERQVRITAGAIVLTGALLAFFVNMHFLWLSAFIGAGLMFSGITDSCGMGMMLARMPWNQVKPETAACDTKETGSKSTCCGG